MVFIGRLDIVSGRHCECFEVGAKLSASALDSLRDRPPVGVFLCFNPAAYLR